MDRLNYWWRLLATGGCFAAFGTGGMLLSGLIFPAMRLLPGRPDIRSRRAKFMIHTFFGIFVWLMRLLGIMRLDMHNAGALRKAGPVIVLANHPTLIDVVVLISCIPYANCIVKSTLWKNPFYGGVVRAAGYISNDDPDALIDDCVASLDDGSPLIIFPEGTRTVPGQPLRFVRGAAHIALKSRAAILPVVLQCDPPTLTKGEKWYKIPPERFRFSIRARPLLDVAGFNVDSEPSSIAARKLTEKLERYFTNELMAHENANT
jgi:1-acyl-sn-glycerol-3-phosphate acyltransferase